jgi:hypothetical protein
VRRYMRIPALAFVTADLRWMVSPGVKPEIVCGLGPICRLYY